MIESESIGLRNRCFKGTTLLHTFPSTTVDDRQHQWSSTRSASSASPYRINCSNCQPEKLELCSATAFTHIAASFPFCFNHFSSFRSPSTQLQCLCFHRQSTMFSRAITSSLRKSSSALSSVSRQSRLLGAASTRPLSAALVVIPSSKFSAAVRQFSSSHDDFAPKRKVVEGEDEALKLIKEHVNNNPIMLYMKGNPSTPMCKPTDIVWKELQ